METRILLAEISRQFLKEHKVYKYRMKKVSEMTDDDVIRYCHWYCEENHLNDEWNSFRNRIESNYKYCCYLEEYINDDRCNNLQLIADNCSVAANFKVDIDEIKECCKDCKYCWTK